MSSSSSTVSIPQQQEQQAEADSIPHPPKHFINYDSLDTIVSEYIQGLLLQYPNRLVKLANQSVILLGRSDTPTRSSSSQVYVLSGGGSGHEPSHAGYIASNMLSGAVLGGIFASPSVSSILAAIRTLCISKSIDTDTPATTATSSSSSSSSSSCLLIVKNYTGDRLNFGMACELAKSQGIPCHMVLVADDVAIPPPSSSSTSHHTHLGARGLAGTVLVHKVAGAAAGAFHHTRSLDQVSALALIVASTVKTIGVALDAVTLPGATTINSRLHGLVMEIGLGIHGEPGWYQCKPMSIRQLIPILISKIYNYGYDEREEKMDTIKSDDISNANRSFQKGDELAVLINNLGGTSNFEMSIVAKETVEHLESVSIGYGCHVSRLYVGSYMTSFNMHGISISILPLSRLPSIVVDLLDAPTDAPGWLKGDIWKRDSKTRLSTVEVVEPPSLIQQQEKQAIDIHLTSLIGVSQPSLVDTTPSSSLMYQRIQAACQALIEGEPLLTKYDTIVGDGDCGFTMQRGAKEILTRLNNGTIPLNPPDALLSSLADSISASMGGSSGILLELMFRNMSTNMKKTRHIDSSSSSSSTYGNLWIEALDHSVYAMSFYGGARKGSRTMLDALYPALESLQVSPDLNACARAVKDGALGTANMTRATAGRSNYLREESLVGTPDPGAVAVSMVFDALAKVPIDKDTTYAE